MKRLPRIEGKNLVYYLNSEAKNGKKFSEIMKTNHSNWNN